MNARLVYDTGFLAGVYWQGQVLFNQYVLKIEMRTVATDSGSHNIALERIKFVIGDLMTNSIFVHDEDKAAIKKLEGAGLRVISLPEIPVDQIVGMMLYCKLSAVTEERMDITQIGLSSDLGEGVVYLQHEAESVGPFEANGWWKDPEPKAQVPATSASKIVKLQKSQTWADLDLYWPEDEQEDDDESDSTVVEFRKDDTK